MISIQLANAACALVSTLGASSLDASAWFGDEPGQSSAAIPAQEESWTFDAFVYYWSASVSGSLTVDGQEIDLEGGDGGGFSGETALSGFLGEFEASRGPWSLVYAPVIVNLDMTGNESGGIDADVEIRARIHEGFAAHALGDRWDWLAGARYYELDTDVDLSNGGVPVGSLGSNHSWVDPIVGVRFHDDLGEDWSVRSRVDVGGFGLGSKFAWNADAYAAYRFSSWCTGDLGYRALSIDFEDGSGSDRLAYNLTMSGPVIGVTFSF